MIVTKVVAAARTPFAFIQSCWFSFVCNSNASLGRNSLRHQNRYRVDIDVYAGVVSEPSRTTTKRQGKRTQRTSSTATCRTQNPKADGRTASGTRIKNAHFPFPQIKKTNKNKNNEHQPRPAGHKNPAPGGPPTGHHKNKKTRTTRTNIHKQTNKQNRPRILYHPLFYSPLPLPTDARLPLELPLLLRYRALHPPFQELRRRGHHAPQARTRILRRIGIGGCNTVIPRGPRRTFRRHQRRLRGHFCSRR